MNTVIITINGKNIQLTKKTKFININGKDVFKIFSIKNIENTLGIDTVIRLKGEDADISLGGKRIKTNKFTIAKKINIVFIDNELEILGLSN